MFSIEYQLIVMLRNLRFLFSVSKCIPSIMSVYPYPTESLDCQISLPKRHSFITITITLVLHVGNQHSF